MGRVIAIVSGKGGVGKTTLTANLGVTLAKFNQSVCLVDGDFGLNNLDVAIGLENRVVYDIMDVLSGKCRLSQGLIKDPIIPNLYLIASTKHNSNKMIGKDDFKAVILDLARVFDYVLIDSPAGIDFGFERAILPAEEVMVVVTPNISSLRDANKAIMHTKSIKEIEVKVVANRMRPDMLKSGEMLGIKDIKDLLGEEIVGVIPESKLLLVGESLKNAFEMDRALITAFNEWGRNLIDNTHFNPEKRKTSPFKFLKNYFRSA